MSELLIKVGPVEAERLTVVQVVHDSELQRLIHERQRRSFAHDQARLAKVRTLSREPYGFD
jgi:hypothetical protein